MFLHQMTLPGDQFCYLVEFERFWKKHHHCMLFIVNYGFMSIVLFLIFIKYSISTRTLCKTHNKQIMVNVEEFFLSI